MFKESHDQTSSDNQPSTFSEIKERFSGKVSDDFLKTIDGLLISGWGGGPDLAYNLHISEGAVISELDRNTKNLSSYLDAANEILQFTSEASDNGLFKDSESEGLDVKAKFKKAVDKHIENKGEQIALKVGMYNLQKRTVPIEEYYKVLSGLSKSVTSEAKELLRDSATKILSELHHGFPAEQHDSAVKILNDLLGTAE
jgi:hypothetical protein